MLSCLVGLSSSLWDCRSSALLLFKLKDLANSFSNTFNDVVSWVLLVVAIYTTLVHTSADKNGLVGVPSIVGASDVALGVVANSIDPLELVLLLVPI